MSDGSIKAVVEEKQKTKSVESKTKSVESKEFLTVELKPHDLVQTDSDGVIDLGLTEGHEPLSTDMEGNVQKKTLSDDEVINIRPDSLENRMVIFFMY